MFALHPQTEAEQVESVRAVRAGRDAAAVTAALDELRAAAAAGRKVLPATVAAVTVYATVGEVVGVLRDVHGSWAPTATF